MLFHLKAIIGILQPIKLVNSWFRFFDVANMLLILISAFGYGFDIIGMDPGSRLQDMGVFVKTIQPGGSADIDGRIKVCERMICDEFKNIVYICRYPP